MEKEARVYLKFIWLTCNTDCEYQKGNKHHGNLWFMFDDTKGIQNPLALGWSRENTMKLSTQHPPIEQRELGRGRNAAANPFLCRQHVQSGALPPAWHNLCGKRWHNGVGTEVPQPPAIGGPAPSYGAATSLDPIAVGLCSWICFGWSLGFWVCTCKVKNRDLVVIVNLRYRTEFS